MKRNDLLSLLLFLLACLFPGICLGARLLDYTVLVRDGKLFSVFTTGLYVVFGILLLTRKEKSVSNVSAVFLSLCPLLNQIHVLFIIFYTDDLLPVLLSIFWTILSVVIVSEYVKSKLLKIPFYVLAGFLTLPILLFLPFIGFGARSSLACELSPDAVYCAEVIDDDQGALGGATDLIVYRKDKSFSVGSFEFRKSQKKIHSGHCGEFESLSWLDSKHLSMNGKTYEIADYYPEALSEKERILRYVRKHEGLLLRYVKKRDDAILINQPIIQEIKSDASCIDFFCGKSGFASQTACWGFYYSDSDDLTALCPTPSDGKPYEQKLQKSGEGYLWQESWEDPRGDNRYYVEPIVGHFYYYELHF